MLKGVAVFVAMLILGGCATVTRGTTRPSANALGAERRYCDGVDGAKLHNSLHDYGRTKRRIQRSF